MRIPWYLGLIVALALTTSVFAQGLSQALPTQYEPFRILDAQTIGAGAGNAVTSKAFPLPAEIVSLDFDSTATAGVGPLTITVTYSDKEDGVFAAGVDTVTAGGMNTVTFNNTPTSGADFKGFSAKWAKFKLTNAVGSIPLLRLSGLRKHLDGLPRPQALEHRNETFGISTAVLTNGSTTAFGSLLPLSGEFVSFFWDTSGSVGTRDLEFYYSNAEAGPFVAWEDQGVASPAFQNKVTSTAIDVGSITGKPFHAAYMKPKFKNSSGASTTPTGISGTRLMQKTK